MTNEASVQAKDVAVGEVVRIDASAWARRRARVDSEFDNRFNALAVFFEGVDGERQFALKPNALVYRNALSPG